MVKTVLKVVSKLIFLTLVVAIISYVIRFGIELQAKKLKAFESRFTIYIDLDDKNKEVLARVGSFNMTYKNVETVESYYPLSAGQKLKTVVLRVSDDIVLLMYIPADYNCVVRSVKIDGMALSHITPDTEVTVY